MLRRETVSTPRRRVGGSRRRFDHFYVAQSSCSSSRPALLTGRWPSKPVRARWFASRTANWRLSQIVRETQCMGTFLQLELGLQGSSARHVCVSKSRAASRLSDDPSVRHGRQENRRCRMQEDRSFFVAVCKTHRDEGTLSMPQGDGSFARGVDGAISGSRLDVWLRYASCPSDCLTLAMFYDERQPRDPGAVPRVGAMQVPFTAVHGSVRFSLSRYNTESDIDRIIEVFPQIVANLRRLSPYWDQTHNRPRDDAADLISCNPRKDRP